MVLVKLYIYTFNTTNLSYEMILGKGHPLKSYLHTNYLGQS